VECPSLPVESRDASIVLPGGASIRAMLPSGPPTASQLSAQLAGQCTAALAPLAPVMSLVEAMMAVVEFAQAVPQLPVNPPAVIEAIDKLVGAAAKVAQVTPQLSLPAMVLSLARLAATMLEGLASDIDALAEQQSRIDAARAVMESTGISAMQEAIDCAESLHDTRLADAQEAAESIAGFTALVGMFGEMIGMSVPAVGDVGEDASTMSAQLRRAARALKAVVR